jgi:CelD/BcsL family acetyltransferase involved in cellulose biosynthesis
MPEIRTITTPDEFLAMQGDWEELLARTSAPNTFLSFDWLTTWWRHYGEAIQICILAAYEGQVLIGLAPLMVQRHQFAGLSVFRRIAFLGTGISDRLDVLSLPGREQVILGAIASYLANQRWDVVDLQEVPEESATARLLPELAEPLGARVEVTAQSICPVINLPEDPEAHFATLSKKLRQNLTYYGKQLRKKHVVTVEFSKSGSRLTEDLQAFIQLYRRSFAHRPGTDKLTGEEFAAFRREVAERLASQNRLLLALLRIDGTEAAGGLCFRYGGTCYCYNLCHDPAWERESVGTILQWEVIQYAITLGCHKFDFLRGDEAYKYRWGALPQRHVRVRITRNTPKLRLLYTGARLARSQPYLGVTGWARRHLLWGRKTSST